MAEDKRFQDSKNIDQKSEEKPSGPVKAGMNNVSLFAATKKTAVKTNDKKAECKPVEVFAAAMHLPAWELAALRQAMGWAVGKQVDAESFAGAVSALRGRRQGGGRL